MANFETAIQINAPVDEVWEVLADIGNIHLWNPGVVDLHLTTEFEELALIILFEPGPSAVGVRVHWGTTRQI